MVDPAVFNAARYRCPLLNVNKIVAHVMRPRVRELEDHR